MTPAHDHRTERLRGALQAAGLDTVLVTDLVNVGWLTGFSGTAGIALVSQSDRIFATDSRYLTQASEECAGWDVRLLQTGSAGEIAALLEAIGSARVGFEDRHLTVHLLGEYRSALQERVELVPVGSLVSDLRAIKDVVELEAIRRACQLADEAWCHIQGRLRPGRTERDIALELEWYIRKERGAELAFPIIVASGPRSALPHARPTDRKLEIGDLVTLDFGARVEGYCSDITRTVVLGPCTEQQEEIYRTVREAMLLLIERLAPGANGRELDAVARDHIRAQGYGDFFGHGAGHQIGRVVHDGPAFSVRSEAVMRPNMVVTVEPGIYLPDWGGVRIENDVLITEAGAEVLTRSSTELVELPT